jgi:hypothetical protein
MIRLKRAVNVKTYEHQATVALAKERPEFLSLARLAEDLGRPINARDVARELLGGLPEQVCWRVIDRAIAIGLLERDAPRGPANLTESGRLMLEQGKILVPEERVWRFHWLEDPLVEQALIHVEHIDTDNAFQARNALYNEENKERKNGGGRGHSLLNPYLHRPLFSLANHQIFEAKEIAKNGASGDSYQLELILEWREGEPQPSLKLRSDISSNSVLKLDANLPIPESLKSVDYLSLWAELVSQSGKVDLEADELKQYCEINIPKHPTLPTTPEQWTEAERRNLHADLTIQNPSPDMWWLMEISPSQQDTSLGKFSPCTLKAVPLSAEDGQSATTWAQWLQWDAIDRYVLPKDLSKQRTEIARKFPIYTPAFLDDAALLDKAKADPTAPAARYLLTPYDLGLWSIQ